MTTKVVQLLCIILAIGFLSAGCVVVVFSPNNPVVSLFLILAVILLVRASLYPRSYVRCRICGAKVRNEVHHQLAHAHEHAQRKEP